MKFLKNQKHGHEFYTNIEYGDLFFSSPFRYPESPSSFGVAFKYAVSTLAIVFSLINLILYIYHPRNKEYLYFALYCICHAVYINLWVDFFWRHFYIESYQSAQLFFTFYILSFLLAARLFYEFTYQRIPVHFWIFIFIGSITIGLCWINFIYAAQLIPVFDCLLMLEIARVCIVHLYQRKKDSLIVGLSGLFFTLLLFIGELDEIVDIVKTDMLGHAASIFFFIFLAVFLAVRHARTSVEIELLNVELEDRVAHRTAELEKANHELRELDKMKTQFVSQASHDLRTPLTAIKGSLDNLLMGIAGALNEKQQKVMTRATTSVDRLTNLINDVLDLNRMETGRIVLEKSDIPFKALVENIINENHPAAEQKQIQLAFVSSEEDCTLHIDGSKIERVVGELISNAIKYTPDNGKVDVCLSHKDNTASLSVKDSGIGMTAEECEKIWERFYRTSASMKFAKGSGLGLSIAKELVELHGGTLSTQSKQDIGTTFYLTLPFGRTE